MKKVTVFVGSPHRGGATYRAARGLLDNLQSYGDVEGEIVMLRDYDLRVCRGCKLCTSHGEELCPLKDDRDVLIEKMQASDGIILASPNYSWMVPAQMKLFLDRVAYLMHRPRLHGKTASAIVVQGIGRGGRIRKDLEFVVGSLGMHVVKGSLISTLEPMTEQGLAKMEKTLAEQARRFHDRLTAPAFPVPSLLQLAMFRMSRTGIRMNVGEDFADHPYYRDRGWFESDYYYPVRLGPLKRATGTAFDAIASRLWRNQPKTAGHAAGTQ